MILSFLWAKLTGNEAALERLSLTPEALNADLQGKSVALIGNAKSLSQGQFGPQIDAADIVIRLNAAPMPSASSHGTKTDWIALSTPIPDEVLAARNPARLLWMTRKRKRLPYALATRPGFYLNRRSDVTALRARIDGPPTTGLMMIDLLSRSQAAKIDLYGFDFFSSLSLSGSRTAAQVPHDFNAERAFVEALLTRDPRFCLHWA
jgi:hypothetical protein